MGRAGWGAIFAILIVATASCSSAPPVKPSPSHDIADARPLAREIAGILLDFAAYDYALVGSLNGDRIRVVTADRYAIVARAQAGLIADDATKIVAAVVDTAGPVRDHLVPLADTLGQLRKDALAYADGRTQDALARVLIDVDRSWTQLHELEGLLKDDVVLDQTIARGMSIKASAASARGALVALGPFATANEAQRVAGTLGPTAVAAPTSPFVVRVAYRDRASADAAAAALQKAGPPALVIDQTAYAFTRSGAIPDVELWREPERSIDTHGAARKVALSSDAGLVATGSDDGYVAIFSNDGALRALPRFNAGVSQLLFTDDARFLFGGGQVLVAWILPQPTSYVGEPMRLTGAATSAVFVPKANAFAASSAGVVGGRAPDGAPLPAPFPIDAGGSLPILGASDDGRLFIALQRGGRGFEIQVLNVGVDQATRPIVDVPGNGRAFAVDRTGSYAAAVTDRGTYLVPLNVADPAKGMKLLTASARDVEFGPDGTLYVLESPKLSAYSGDGGLKWTRPLTDGRRIAVGLRAVVLDGTDKLVAFAPQDGTPDVLAPVGQVQDLVISRDGRWAGVIADARRAVLFRLTSATPP